MAVLLVRIDNTDSLPLNEFYDYNGMVYAISRSRNAGQESCIRMEDFYEASVDTTELADVPVIFLCEKRILGWYRKAVVHRYLTQPSFFLEGNIQAVSADAVLLPEEAREKASAFLFGSDREFFPGNRCYEVVEQEDPLWEPFLALIKSYQGKNAFLRYPYVQLSTDPRASHNAQLCLDHCAQLAEALMADECRDITQIKLLEYYAERLSSMKPRDPDGWYYLAMACDQLGFLKKGMKAISKALALEEDAPDLIAEKGNLLIGMGLPEAAAACYHEAWLIRNEEDYRIYEGKAWLIARKPDKAYEAFHAVTDPALLERFGIELKAMERKWPFVNLRGFHLKDLFHKI